MKLEDYCLKVKNLLIYYKDNETKQRVFGKVEEHNFLKHCLCCLEDYEKHLITSIMVDKISIRCYSRKSGFSRSFIAKERDRIISLIAKFFMVRENYKQSEKIAG
ncbi:MAG: hypothetical protein GX242_02380 [Clostridiales bacterium]|nr:hypothetical protein [Clostridiales bacterium]